MQTDCKKSPCTGDEADKGIPPLTYWPQPPHLPWARPLQLGATPAAGRAAPSLSAPDSLGGGTSALGRTGTRECVESVRTGTRRRSSSRGRTTGSALPFTLEPRRPVPRSGPPQGEPAGSWAAGRAGRRYVPAVGLARGNPPPVQGCGPSADSRSRYVSAESQAGQGAKPGPPPAARVFIYPETAARAGAVGLASGPALACGCGDFTLPPGCWPRSLITFMALSLQQGCDLGSAAGMCARQGLPGSR